MTPTEAPRRPQSAMTMLALALGALALLAMPALAAAKDRNHDRIPDRWEKHHKLSLKANQARRDQDHDHLRNRAEFLAGDNPRDADSDDDGVMDGNEQAGTIASFDAETGRLVIDLFGSDTIAGVVNGDTEIKCDDDSSTASSSSEGSDSGEAEPGDDNGGEGEEEVGDDNGDHEEADDDNGGDHEEGDDNSGPGSENSGPGHEGDDDHGDRLCTTAELVPGAVVEEAELKVSSGQATFTEVELSGKEVS